MSSNRLPPLLTITTPAGVVEIRGPHFPPAGLMRGIDLHRCGYLRIGGFPLDDISANYLDPLGTERPWDTATMQGPLLYEDTTYHLWVESPVSSPIVLHRDPLFVRDITHRTDHRIATGTFNLGRQVGRLTFNVTFADRRLEVELEVVPTKLDYATDYQELLTDINASARGLAFAYLRSTHLGAKSNNDPSSEIEWLTLLRQDIRTLQQAVARISEQPHRHLTREVTTTPNHKIRRLDSATRRAISAGKGTGPADFISGVGPVRRVLDSVQSVATLNTPEHRWLQTQIRQVHRRLTTLGTYLATEAGTASRPLSARRRHEAAEVADLATKVKQLLEAEPLRAADELQQSSPPSLTMLSAAGYRDAYRILTGLRVGLTIGGAALELQLKDVHHLYELWCYLEVVKLVVAKSGATDIDPADLIKTHLGALRVGLTVGAHHYVPVSGSQRTFTIAYNRTYSGQTGDQKPDIVITVHEPTLPSLVIVLDAKYRVDATKDFRRRYGAPGPPIDAINALHRYRDAIVVGKQDPYRPVVRCAALFPLTREETADFASTSILHAALDDLGVGALPFLPGNTDMVGDWLAALLTLPSRQLAWNGVPGPDVHRDGERSAEHLVGG